MIRYRPSLNYKRCQPGSGRGGIRGARGAVAVVVLHGPPPRHSRIRRPWLPPPVPWADLGEQSRCVDGDGERRCGEGDVETMERPGRHTTAEARRRPERDMAMADGRIGGGALGIRGAWESSRRREKQRGNCLSGCGRRGQRRVGAGVGGRAGELKYG